MEPVLQSKVRAHPLTPPPTVPGRLTPPDRPQGSTGSSGRELLSQHSFQNLRGPWRAIEVQTIAIRATRLNVKIEANLRADAMLRNQRRAVAAVAAVAVEVTLRLE